MEKLEYIYWIKGQGWI